MIVTELNVGETLAGRTTVHTPEMMCIVTLVDDHVARLPAVTSIAVIDVMMNTMKTLHLVVIHLK